MSGKDVIADWLARNHPNAPVSPKPVDVPAIDDATAEAIAREVAKTLQGFPGFDVGFGKNIWPVVLSAMKRAIQRAGGQRR